MSIEGKARHMELEAYGPDPFKCHIRDVTYHSRIVIDIPFITEVGHNLYQGGCRGDLILPELFKHVISLYPWEKYIVRHDLDSEMYVRTKDGNEVNPLEVARIGAWASHCVFRGPTLIHCQAGLNRSSLIVAQVLKKRHPEMTGQAIIDLMREKRSPAVLCNKTFEQFVQQEW